MPTISNALRLTTVTLLLVGAMDYISPVNAAGAAPPQPVPGEGFLTVQLPAAEKATGPRLPLPGNPLSGSTTPLLQAASPSGGFTTQSSPTDLAIFNNSSVNPVPLPPSTATPTPPEEVASPAAANAGLDMFATYNKGAALSVDNGTTWFYIDPRTMETGNHVPWESLHGGFNGNQDVLYDPNYNLMIWILGYQADGTGNAFRVAWTTGDAAGLEANLWLSVALEPDPFCPAPLTGTIFGRPHLARTYNFLYLVTDVYDSTPAFVCTTVIRIPLATLASGFLNTSVYYSEVGESFAPAQGGTTKLYFARHEDGTHLRVYDWAESLDPTIPGAVMPSATVLHAAYASTGYSCLVSGVDPCAADDKQLTTGWLRAATNELGFMWDAAQDPGPTPTHPYPYVKILTMNASSKAVISETAFASSSFAWFLASSGVNARGDVGGTLARAGGSTFPSCSVWVYDDISNLAAFTNLDVVTASANPSGNHWGAYFRTRTNGLNPYQWLGTCYAIESGTVTPHVVAFGRVRDQYLTSWVGGVAVSGDQSIVGLGEPHVGDQVMAYNAFPAGGTTMYVPMLFRNAWGSYDSALYVQNMDAGNPADLIIEYRDWSGNLTCTHTDQIAPRSSHGYWLGSECVPAGWFGGATITSTTNIGAIGRPHVATEVLSYDGFAGGSLSMYVPMLFSGAWGSYESALYVQNTDALNPAAVTITYRGWDGTLTCSRLDSIPALSSHGYWMADECVPRGWVGDAVITSDRNIIAVGRPHVGNQVSAYNGFSSGALTAAVPTLYKAAGLAGDYNSALYAQNVDAGNSASITVDFYDSSGASTCSFTDTLAPLSARGYWIPDVSCLPNGWVGSAIISADHDIVALGRSHLGTEVFAFDGSSAGSLLAYVPMLFSNAWGSYNAAFQLLNLNGASPANITIDYYDINGVHTCSKSQTLAARELASYWVPDVLTTCP